MVASSEPFLLTEGFPAHNTQMNRPLSSEYGNYATVKPRFCTALSCASPYNLLSCSLLTSAAGGHNPRSGSEEGSYLRLIHFSITQCSRVIKRRRRSQPAEPTVAPSEPSFFDRRLARTTNESMATVDSLVPTPSTGSDSFFFAQPTDEKNRCGRNVDNLQSPWWRRQSRPS